MALDFSSFGCRPRAMQCAEQTRSEREKQQYDYDFTLKYAVS